MMQRDYRHDVSGLQASSQRHEAAGRPRLLPEEWRDKWRSPD
jgi:hypothetical protein